MTNAFCTTNLKDPAMRRYTIRVLMAMTFYFIAIFAVGFTFRLHHPHGAAAYLLAVIPALPILAVIAIFGMCLAELRDELVRTVMVHSSLWATGVILALTTFWGFLETYTRVPTIPMYWVFILWWVAFALVQPLVWRRYK